MRLRTIEITFGAVFVCLMAIGANVTAWFPILAIPIGGVTVPVSLQTFFAILAGFVLGKKLGSIAMITYALIGFAGVPVFANFSAGPSSLVSPLGGFILSFIFVAYFAGLVVQFTKKPSIATYSIAALVGLTVNYTIGVTYMYIAMNTWMKLSISIQLAWAGMIPFIIKDLGMSIIAVFFIIAIKKRIPTLLAKIQTRAHAR